jgi:hypothetical protein
MRHVWFISLLPALPPALAADEITATEKFSPLPSSYQILRFDENYSYLSNPTNRTDLFDPFKYIPLRSGEPAWYLGLGGELRERFEGNYDPDFGIGGASPDSHLLQRATVLADLHLGERVRFFAEGVSGLMEGESQSAPRVQQDPVDLAYAFLDIVPYLNGGESLTLRAGRFGLNLGSSRLVATRAAAPSPNIPFRFDGFEAHYAASPWDVTAFLTQPAHDSGGFSGENHATTFWGLYLTRWFEHSHSSGIDLYYLGIYNERATYASGTADEHRHSFGLRVFGQRGQWDWNEEDVIQTGSFGNNSILAWTASLDAGYTWAAMWQPRLGLKAAAISGSGSTDGGTQETFDALYPNPDYINDASVLRPANFLDVHPNIAVNPARNISANGGADIFWRYSRNDAVYSPSGYIAIPALHNQSAYIATALDVNLQWRIQRHVTFLASYVHFFTGNYVHAAGGRDMDFVSTTISFVF